MADEYEKGVEDAATAEPAKEQAAAEHPRVEAPPPRVPAAAPTVRTTPPRMEEVEEEEDLPNLVYESDSDSESEDEEEKNKPRRRIVASSKIKVVASKKFPKSTPLPNWMPLYMKHIFTPNTGPNIIKSDAPARITRSQAQIHSIMDEVMLLCVLMSTSAAVRIDPRQAAS